MGAQTAMYHGQIVELQGSQLVAALHSSRQDFGIAVDLDLARADGVVTGAVLGARALGRDSSIG